MLINYIILSVRYYYISIRSKRFYDIYQFMMFLSFSEYFHVTEETIKFYKSLSEMLSNKAKSPKKFKIL